MVTATPITFASDRLQSLIQSLSAGVIVADAQGILESFNDAAEQILGLGISNMRPSQWTRHYGFYRADAEVPCQPHEFPLIRALQGEVVDGMELVIVNEVISRPVTVSVSGVPIRDVDGNFDGAVAVIHDVSRHKASERILQSRIRQLEEFNAELIRLSQTDDLTDLPSRRAFDAAMLRSVAIAKQDRTSVCLLLADIDHFKCVNDQFGHQAGDEVLRRLGELIRDAATGSGMPARLGGEEFAIVLDAMSLDEAAEFAETLRAQVAATQFALDDIPWGVTISIGVCELLQCDDVNTLFRRADGALYVAKEAGRNCVCRRTAERDFVSGPDCGRRESRESDSKSRRWIRHSVDMGEEEVLITIGSAVRTAKLLDRSIGGVGLRIAGFDHLRLGAAVRVAWRGVSQNGTIRNLSLADAGLWRVGVGWDQHD